MAQSAERSARKVVATAADRSTQSLQDGAANVTERDIARRAYELYLARDGEHGHDVEDWLQAEHELRATERSTGA
jgi:hypothetical protein